MSNIQKLMKYKHMKYILYILYFIYFLYKRFIKAILKSVLFISILLLLITNISKILASPIGTTLALQTGLENIHKYPNSYDVCFLGTSTVITNISNQELYNRYGISGISLGEPQQPFYLTRYTLEEVFEYQSPKVIFVDTKAMLYSKETDKALSNVEDYILHNSLDGIQTLSIKKKALERAKKYNKNIDYWDYYSKLYYSHDNWKDITELNFTGYSAKDCMNGNYTHLGIASLPTNVYDLSSLEDTFPIRIDIERDLLAMIELCRENGTEFVLMSSYVDATKAQHRSLSFLARKYNIPFIDINEYLIKSNFQHTMDLADNVHFNLSGSIKMTDFIGEYLQKNYKFTDKRNDKSYNRFEEQNKLFEIQKDFIYTQQSLLSAVSFYDYLEELTLLDKKTNIIFLNIYDNAVSHLTKVEAEMLKKLGLKVNLLNKKDCSYAAVISADSVLEDYSYFNTTTIKSKIQEVPFEISSSGTYTNEPPSIMINDTETCQKGKGFNFVIYNKDLEKVVHSCFFDTSVSINPPQSRYKSNINSTLQKATEPNIWE